MSENLIEVREYGDYRVSVYYEDWVSCPTKVYDLMGRYLFSSGGSDRLSCYSNWEDYLDSSAYTFTEALRAIALKEIPSCDLIKFLKSGDGIFRLRQKDTQEGDDNVIWALEVKDNPLADNSKWDEIDEFLDQDLERYSDEIYDNMNADDIEYFIKELAENIAIVPFFLSGHSQGDWATGYAYMTKASYASMVGEPSDTWKFDAIQEMQREVNNILNRWMWSDVKQWKADKKVPFIKVYEDGRNMQSFEYEEVCQSGGYYLETEEVFKLVEEEFGLK